MKYANNTLGSPNYNLYKETAQQNYFSLSEKKEKKTFTKSFVGACVYLRECEEMCVCVHACVNLRECEQMCVHVCMRAICDDGEEKSQNLF